MEIDKCVGWELPAKAPMDPVYLLSQVYISFLYSSDIITYYYVPHVYNFMLFVYVIKQLILLYLVHWKKLNWIELNVKHDSRARFHSEMTVMFFFILIGA